MRTKRNRVSVIVLAIVAGGMIGAGAPASPGAPMVSPTASQTTLQGFSTPVPPDPSTAWTGIDWHTVAAGDPLALVRTVVRWHGGFLALGAEVASGESWRTPAWVSADGATWRPLDAAVFGPTTIVLGIGEAADGLVALTLASGANQCGDDPAAFSCWTLAAPLQSWTSPDGTTWTAHPGPTDTALPEEGCDECGVGVPSLRSGAPGLLVVNRSGTPAPNGSRLAFSQDGIAWQMVPADAFPAGFDVTDVARSGTGFIATGEQAVTVDGEETVQAVALSSGDGQRWETANLPTTGLDPKGGSSAGRIVVGTQGAIITGSDAGVPGTELWWSSVAGGPSTRLEGYPPLGVWTGEGEGSGLIPNGTLVADGERLVAYRDGATPKGWTSLDGRSWQTLAISGAGPTNAGDWPLQDLHLTPIGVFATSDDGTVWFGTPRT